MFETVFSDPLGEKVAFLKEAVDTGHEVVLCFIRIPDAETSEQRVSMRVSQGGHDVPSEKLKARFPRTLANLARGIRLLPHVLIYDNSNLNTPFWQVARFANSKLIDGAEPLPEWLVPLVD